MMELNAKRLGIIAFLGVFLSVLLITAYLYAQPNKKEVIGQIQELQNTPTTSENLQQRSQEIKQLLRLLEQKEGKETVEQIVSPDLKQRFRRAEQSGDYLTASQIADEIIANLAEFAKTAKGKGSSGKEGRAPTDEHIVKFKAKDGEDVYGYLLKPEGEGRFPAIVLVHGGKSSKQATINIGQGPQAQAFNKEGYVTLAVDYRPSEYGGKEIDDVAAAVAYLKTLSFVDSERIGLFGSSHGAYMSLMAAAELGREVKAVAENFAFTDLGKEYYDVVEGRTSHSEKDIDEIIKMGEEYYGGSPKESPETYMQLSPVYNVNRIQTPVLIIHGKEDQSVLVYQAYELRDALEKAGKTYEIKIYENGPHGFIYKNTPEAKDALKLTINFFNKYLKEPNRPRTNLPNEKLRDNPHQKILRGKIIYVSVEGGFYKLNGYVLVSEDEEVLQKIKRLEGNSVEVKGKVKEDTVSIFMSGPLFEVEEIKELKSGEGSTINYFDSPFGFHSAYYDVAPFENAEEAGVRWDRGAGIGNYITPMPQIKKDKKADKEKTIREAQRRIENKVYTWDYFDSYIRQVPEGIDIVQNIGPVKKEVTPWVKFFNRPNSWLPKDEYMDYYLTFIEKAVERYDGDGIDDMPGLVLPIKYWQISNEPHYKPNMKDLAKLIKITQPVIKKADPQAKIILGGASLQPQIDDYLKQLREYYYPILDELGGKYIDVFDFHWYGKADGDYRKIKVIYEDIRKNLDLRGYKDTEIWVTEMGTYSGDPEDRKYDWLPQTEREHAIDLLKRYVYSLSLGIKKVFWAWGMIEGFPPSDDNHFFDHTGLIYDGEKLSGQDIDMGRGVKKLAFYTYKLMTEKLEGCDCDNIETVVNGKDNVYVYKFIREGKPIYIVWWDYFDDTESSKTVALNVDFSGQALVTEAVPNADSGVKLNSEDYPKFFKIQTLTINNNKVTLTLRNNPVFVEGG